MCALSRSAGPLLALRENPSMSLTPPCARLPAGDLENLGCVEPGARRLLRTFATHIWRFRDARSHAAVTEFVVNYDTRSVHIRQDKQGALCASMTTGNGRPSPLPVGATEG